MPSIAAPSSRAAFGRGLARVFVVIAGLAFAGAAVAASPPEDGAAQTFVQKEQQRLHELLRQPASPTRDANVNKQLETDLDLEEMVHRSFGQPCPSTLPTCVNHWDKLGDAQRKEVSGLLHRLVERTYRRNLEKTLDFEIAYKGSKEQAGESRVRTEAKSKLKPRDPPVQIDYVLKGAGGGAYRIVDIVTEGSSVTKNYYDQFHKMLTTADQGYPYLVKKLNDKLAQPEEAK
jgi:ABC-type transporter MlaC component